MTTKFRKFNSLPSKLKLLFIEAVFTQYVVWTLLKVIPFRWVPRIFKNPHMLVDDPDKEIPEKIRLVTGYARSLAFWKNRCLVQSLTARHMLRRRGINTQLHLGVKKDDTNKMIAHAWLNAGDVEIVPQMEDYKELFSL